MGYTFRNLPIIWNNKLYIDYNAANHHHQLARLNGKKLIAIPNPDLNPDTINGYAGYPVIYKKQLYFMYITDSGFTRLSYLDLNGFANNYLYRTRKT